MNEGNDVEKPEIEPTPVERLDVMPLLEAGETRTISSLKNVPLAITIGTGPTLNRSVLFADKAKDLL